MPKIPAPFSFETERRFESKYFILKYAYLSGFIIVKVTKPVSKHSDLQSNSEKSNTHMAPISNYSSMSLLPNLNEHKNSNRQNTKFKISSSVECKPNYHSSTKLFTF